MSSPSRQEFFDHVEQLLKQEVSTPGDFLLPLFYLHLLCLPPPHWVAVDLLHFWNADSWQVAFQAPETKAAVVQQLRRYPLLIQRLRGLLLYFLAERNVPDPTNQPLSSLQKYLACNFSHDRPRPAPLHFDENFHLADLLDFLLAETVELYAQSLPLLAQHGLIEVLSSSSDTDLLIRLKRFPSQKSPDNPFAFLSPPSKYEGNQ